MQLDLLMLLLIQLLSEARTIEDQCVFQSKVDSVNFLRKPDVDPFLKETNRLRFELGTSLYRKDPATFVEDIGSNTKTTETAVRRQKPVRQSGFFRISLYRTRYVPPPPPPPPCSSNPCQEGMCSDSGSSYSCLCNPGWTGTQCNIDIDECASNPCLNSATCNDAVNYYWCDCEEDYTGTNCETDMCYPSEGADIIFIADTSRSQGEYLLQHQLDYIKSIVSTFPIGYDDFRFSLISASTSPVLYFDLNTHLSNVTLLDAVDAVKQTNGTSNLDTAISMARNQVFANITSSKTKYVVTLADGMYNNHESTISEVFQMKLAGITLVSIGFGRQILHQSLADISTDYRYVFSPTTTDLTHWLSRRHAMDTCPDCSTQYSDIFVLFETSLNLSLSIFYQLLRMLTTFVEAIPLGQDRAHLSFATFDSTVTEKFDFVTHYDKISAIKETGQTKPTQQTSNYTNALQHIKDNTFVSAKGYREGSRKIVVLFMPELITDIDTIKSQVDAVKVDNVTIIIVTASSQTRPDLAVLQEIVSDPAYLFVLGQKVYGSATAIYTLSTMFEYSLCIFD